MDYAVASIIAAAVSGLVALASQVIQARQQAEVQRAQQEVQERIERFRMTGEDTQTLLGFARDHMSGLHQYVDVLHRALTEQRTVMENILDKLDRLVDEEEGLIEKFGLAAEPLEQLRALVAELRQAVDDLGRIAEDLRNASQGE